MPSSSPCRADRLKACCNDAGGRVAPLTVQTAAVMSVRPFPTVGACGARLRGPNIKSNVQVPRPKSFVQVPILESRHGPSRHEIRRHLRRQYRAHPQCRAACEARGRRRPSRSPSSSPPCRARPTSSSPGASEAAALYDPREYDAVVASGEQVTSGLLAIVAAGHGHPGALLAGLADPDPDRRRPRLRPHHRHRRRRR